jgi:hypothetical protein
MPSPSGLHRFLPTLAFCAAMTAVGVHFSTIPDVPAGKPFSYVPPSTFNPISLPANLDPANAVERVWVEPTAVSKINPRITLTHSPQETPLDGFSLAPIADGMPALYAKSGGQWTEERHIVHVRPDERRVGIIVGDLVSADQSHLKTVQMIFPDDTGTSIVTASFDQVSAQRLVPELEASMDAADGLKKPGKKAENNVYFAWFFGSLIFAVIAQILFNARKRTS